MVCACRKFFAWLLVFALSACTGSRSPNINGQGYGGRVDYKSLASIVATYPLLGSADEIYCRSLDPKMDPAEVVAINPSFSEMIPMVEFTIRLNGQGGRTAQVKFLDATGSSIDYLDLTLTPLENGNVLYSQAIGFFTMMVNLNFRVLGEYVFGASLIYNGSLLGRNLLCRASPSLLAQSPGAYPSSEPNPSELALVSPDSTPWSSAPPSDVVLNAGSGSWSSPCQPWGDNSTRTWLIFEGDRFRSLTYYYAGKDCQNQDSLRRVTGRYSIRGAMPGLEHSAFVDFVPETETLTALTEGMASVYNVNRSCGLTGWTAGMERSVVGLSCPGVPVTGMVDLTAYALLQRNGFQFTMVVSAEGRPTQLGPSFLEVFNSENIY